MQQKKEERRQTEETTTSFSRSISKRYQYTDNKKDFLEKILAQFIDIETGVCLECGQVHGFTNIDEARRRRQKNNSPYLDRLFWPEVPI
jgi:hypothetical protein